MISRQTGHSISDNVREFGRDSTAFSESRLREVTLDSRLTITCNAPS